MGYDYGQDFASLDFRATPELCARPGPGPGLQHSLEAHMHGCAGTR